MAAFPVPSRDPMVQAYLKLSTPNVSDALDRLQLHGAPHGIAPLWPGCPKIVGRATTIRHCCAFAGHSVEVQLAGVTVRPGAAGERPPYLVNPVAWERLQ